MEGENDDGRQSEPVHKVGKQSVAQDELVGCNGPETLIPRPPEEDAREPPPVQHVSAKERKGLRARVRGELLTKSRTIRPPANGKSAIETHRDISQLRTRCVQ